MLFITPYDIQNYLVQHDPMYAKGYEAGYEQAKLDMQNALKKMTALHSSTTTNDL